MLTFESIEEAHENLKGVVLETPCPLNPHLSSYYGCSLYLKREDLQVVRSFKVRGAFNKMSRLDDVQKSKGVVCASAGNHAQGVAFACRKLGIRGSVYMPHPTPLQKLNKVRQFGGDLIEIVLEGDTFDDAFGLALEEAEQQGRVFVHPFDDYEVMAGQGTVAMEMLHQLPVSLDYLIIAVGGGGLFSGVGTCFAAKSPYTKLIAVEASGAPAFFQSRQAGRRIRLDKIDTFADGIAVKEIGANTFPILQKLADGCMLVPEGKISSTILKLYTEEAIVAEPAGAIALAALDSMREEIAGKNVGVILCGGNNDVSRTQEITERAAIYEGKKHYFIIRFPQRAGALREFLDLLGPDDDITHFEYTKKTNKVSGPAMVGIELGNADDFSLLVTRFNQAGINYEHLNKNPLLFEMWI